MTIATAALTQTPIRHRFTVAEYYAMARLGIIPENDRVELLDGDIIHMPPIGDWHIASVNRLIDLLHTPLKGRVVFSVQSPMLLNPNSEPQPDVMLAQWRDDYYEGGRPRPADVLLLIEVSGTTLDYDRNKKLTAYARARIPEVWIVSRENRRIESYTEPSEGSYSNVRYTGPTETIAPQAFPDVALEVGRFFTQPKPKTTSP